MKKFAFALAAAMLAVAPAFADSAGVVGANQFPQKTGAELYGAICQGCHMPDGKGAIGAGAYPALAGDPNLASSGFPVFYVLYGQKAMPGFGGFLDDAQVAEVVNYVRSHFGNSYADAVKAEDVKSTRQPDFEYYTLD